MSDFNDIPATNDITVNDGTENIKQETTLDITDKKCPNCAATIEYDPDTRTLACPYCG